MYSFQLPDSKSPVLKLGCKPEDILLVRHVTSHPENVTIHHIKGFGVAGKQRRPQLQKRIKAARRAIAKLHDTVGFIDFKQHAEPDDLYHFSDARGSNAFAKLDAVASFGIPYPNISAIQSEYEVLVGAIATTENPEFQTYLNSKVTSEIRQEIGRLRANRRLDEDLNYYLCGDCDTSFLEQLGYTILTQNAIALDVEAGDKQTKARTVLLEACKQLQQQGQKVTDITQKQVAEVIGKTQQSIHHLAKSFGGWQKLKESLGCLLYTNPEAYREDLGELEEDALFYAQSYLPTGIESSWDEFVAELPLIDQTFGKATYQQILNNIPVPQATAFLVKIVSHLPWSDRQEFISLVRTLT